MTDNLAAYVDRSIALAFERKTAYFIECKAGYGISKCMLGSCGAYTATKAGKVLACERFTTADEQTKALQVCKDACAAHWEGKK